MSTKQIVRESQDGLEVTTSSASSKGPTRALITLIRPGKGASGFYSKESLAQAAEDKVWPRGTQMHIDHDTDLERAERPEGTLRNLAAVLTEDAYQAEDGRLVAEALISSAWAPTITEFKDFIGTSIVAPAEVSVREGQRVIERLIPAKTNRVDFVTIAGAGGQIDQILESISGRALLVQESWNRDLEERLRTAIRDTFGMPQQSVWLTDFDTDRVIFNMWDSAREADRYYSQGYEDANGAISFTGDRIEVRRQVDYIPVNSPAAPAGVQESAKTSQEDNVAKVEIDEQELAQLRESASRVSELQTSLETERAARAAETEARESAARQARIDAAKATIKEAYGDEAPVLLISAAESLAAKDDFDASAFRTQVQESLAASESLQGAGTPRNLGAASHSTVREAFDPSKVSFGDALSGKA